jgi:hypothetical protein
MKGLIITLALLLTAPALVRAENTDNTPRAQFYFFTGPLVSNTQYYFNPAYAGVVFTGPPPANLNTTAVGGNNTGFGGELLPHSWAGVGLGIELGYAGPNWSFDGGGAVGTGSVNGSYHFLAKKQRKWLDPFATGGYSLYFGQRTTFDSGYNLGGGVNFWVLKHVALRSEIRYQGGINYFDGFSQFKHYAAFRFGMSFR